MKLFKSFVLTGLMAVVAYGVYATIVKGPGTHTASGPPPLWGTDPPPGPVDITPGEPMLPPQPLPHQPEEPGMSSPPPFKPFPLPPTNAGNELSPATPTSSTQPVDPAAANVAPAGGASPVVPESVSTAAVPANPAPNPHAGPSADASGNQAAFDAVLATAQKQMNEGQYADVHMQLSRWYTNRGQLGAEREHVLLELLDRLAAQVVYSPVPYLDQPHMVQQGETLETIAARYGVTSRLLEKINGIQDPAQVLPGSQLKVLRGPFHADVVLSKYELTLFLNDGRYAGRFPIGIGSEVPAKEGKYVVTSKQYDPPYSFETGGGWQEVRGGDPNNPLGNRLVELGTQVDQPGELAIHSTNNPATIGGTAREGCIRLQPRDADDVYDILSKNTSEVIIRR